MRPFECNRSCKYCTSFCDEREFDAKIITTTLGTSFNYDENKDSKDYFADAHNEALKIADQIGNAIVDSLDRTRQNTINDSIEWLKEYFCVNGQQSTFKIIDDVIECYKKCMNKK